MKFIHESLLKSRTNQSGMSYFRNELLGEDAPTLIFLHGFPESSYAWCYFLPFFANLGFNVFAVDLRGYFLSCNYKEQKDFEINYLVDDIYLLINQFSLSNIFLVGHDLGGAVAWQFSESYPNYLEGLILFNSPHPGAYAELFRAKPWLTVRQTCRIWYMYVFQLKWLPEAIMSKGNGFWIDYIFKRWIRYKALNLHDRIYFYKQSVACKHALSQAIATYRCNVFGSYGLKILKNFFTKKNLFSQINIPVKMFWGRRDFVFENDLFFYSKLFCSNGIDMHEFKNGGHWLHHEFLEKVLPMMIDFLRSNLKIEFMEYEGPIKEEHVYSESLMALYESLLKQRKKL